MTGTARLRGVVPSAYLRVYQPIEAFDAAEQRHWERYLVERARSASLRPRYLDHGSGRALGFMQSADGEHAEVQVVDGRTYVSPWRVRLRTLAAVVAFRDSQPIELSEHFVTKKDARRAARQLRRFARRDRGALAFCHQSPWHVPIRWFVLFDDGERWLGEDPFGRTRLRYRTSVRKAMRRIERAIPILRRSELGPISDLILDIYQWMSAFEPAAIVELDYSSLCDLLTWDELDDDRSVRDLHEALDALERVEFQRSADIYQVVLSRWAEVRGREIWN